MRTEDHLIDLTAGSSPEPVVNAFFDALDRQNWAAMASTLCDRVQISGDTSGSLKGDVPGAAFVEYLRTGVDGLTIERVVRAVREDGSMDRYAANISTFCTDGTLYHRSRAIWRVTLHMHPGEWCIGEVQRDVLHSEGNAELAHASHSD